MDRLIDTLETLATKNNYFYNMFYAARMLKGMSQNGMTLNQALLCVPKNLPEFLTWIGILDVDLPNEFIDRYQDDLDWIEITGCIIFAPISRSFIDKHFAKLDWICLCESRKTDEDTMRTYADYLDWKTISYRKSLPEAFMRDYANRLDWYHISTRQRFSLGFIREFGDKLYATDNLKENIEREHAALQVINIQGMSPEIVALIATYM